MHRPRYFQIVDHYERRLAEHGETHKGVDWPKAEDVDVRNEVMLGVCEGFSGCAALLDLGCGIGLLPDFLRTRGLLDRFEYLGIDLSARMIEGAVARHPDLRFEVRDVLSNPLASESFDYVIMNGILTVKASLTHLEMEEFATSIITNAFRLARHGLAFNVMSEHVDWKREDLFHWPFDRVAAFLKRACSRHIVFRADYGLYEYTTYVFREPRR